VNDTGGDMTGDNTGGGMAVDNAGGDVTLVDTEGDVPAVAQICAAARNSARIHGNRRKGVATVRFVRYNS